MHPKKNRCITFWGGWKYRGLETNAMTLRLTDSVGIALLAVDILDSGYMLAQISSFGVYQIGVEKRVGWLRAIFTP